MKINYESEKPIFMQLAEEIENAVISGAFPEGEQIPSITELSATLKINPATANKGVNMLVDAGIVYKKRGLGMFVQEGAVKMLTEKKKNEFIEEHITALVDEAKKLGLTKKDVLSIIEKQFDK
ncbi:MAG: GntR family transcriptional regulator [Eubacteriaceae bacterium]|jgi:DNA-binding transcriptional regulator YhcF (GntR family)|nr:GntR family transcriptional regulator [Eubacteriaceae bacterium]